MKKFMNKEVYQEKTEDKIQEQENLEGAQEQAPSEDGQQKKGKRKKRKKKRYFLKFLILIALCVGIYFFLHSSVFDVKKIKVSGNQHFTAEQVQKLADLKVGINLFEFRTGKCEEKLEEDPYIEEANISRNLPSGIEIQIKERQEAAVVQIGKQYVLLDRNGIVLQITDKMPQVTLLSGFTVASASAGQMLETKDEEAFDQVMEVLKVMQNSDLFFKKIEINGETITAYVTDRLVCVGKQQNFIDGMKEGNLKAVLYDLNKKKIKKGVVTIGDQQYYSFNPKTK